MVLFRWHNARWIIISPCPPPDQSLFTLRNIIDNVVGETCNAVPVGKCAGERTGELCRGLKNYFCELKPNENRKYGPHSALVHSVKLNQTETLIWISVFLATKRKQPIWMRNVREAVFCEKFLKRNSDQWLDFAVKLARQKRLVARMQTPAGRKCLDKRDSILIFRSLQARRMQAAHPDWTDEELFQAARRWVIATLQVRDPCFILLLLSRWHL